MERLPWNQAGELASVASVSAALCLCCRLRVEPGFWPTDSLVCERASKWARVRACVYRWQCRGPSDANLSIGVLSWDCERPVQLQPFSGSVVKGAALQFACLFVVESNSGEWRGRARETGTLDGQDVRAREETEEDGQDSVTFSLSPSLLFSLPLSLSLSLSLSIQRVFPSAQFGRLFFMRQTQLAQSSHFMRKAV